jgi:hypothetical protein
MIRRSVGNPTPGRPAAWQQTYPPRHWGLRGDRPGAAPAKAAGKATVRLPGSEAATFGCTGPTLRFKHLCAHAPAVGKAMPINSKMRLDGIA